MVRRGLRRDVNSARPGFADGADAARGADVRDVQVRAGHFRQQDVALDHGHLGGGGHARQAEARRDRAFVHAPARGEREIFRVHHHRQAEIAGVFQCAAHHARRHHRATVVGEADAPRFLELRHVGELFAVRSARDRSGRKDVRKAGFASAPADESRDRGRVADRLRVRHRHQRGDAAGRRRARSGGDRLFALFARFAQVHMKIDQAGQHPLPPAIDHLMHQLLGRRRRLLSNFTDLFAVDQDGSRPVDLLRRVDHSS